MNVSGVHGLFAALVCGVFILGLVACSEDPPPPAPQVERPPPSDDAFDSVDLDEDFDDETTEVEEAESGYTYSPIGKRDPFRSPFEDLLAMDREQRGSEERLTPLQKWDLEQLRVSGIISATARPMAMVVDPEGHGHMVRRGVLIGRNWGRVTAIRRECLVITEQMRDPTGASMAVQQERCLPADERERSFEEQMRDQLR